jgi:iron complex outermembrane receptor protein
MSDSRTSCRTLAAAVRSILLLPTVALAAPAVSAQTSDPGASSRGLEEIVVTARKREETLLEVPVSITAFSGDDIVQKGFQNLEDVARLAPGIQYSQMGGQIPGRFTSAIRFRGMNVNSDSPSLQLGALFLDGIYVLGGTQSIPLNDIERIEVIKGPQSATYGRSTFGGAVNYITRTPSLTEYSGQLNLMAANYSESDVSGSFEGPLFGDKVAFRIGGRYYSRGALYTASDGGGLGEEESKSANLTLYAEPTDGWSMRFRAFYNEDSDGPTHGGIVQGYRNDSCTGRQISTEDPNFPIANPRNYVCGTVPEQGSAISATGGTNIIDTVTTLRPPLAVEFGAPDYIVDNLVNRPEPPQVDVPNIDHIGLERRLTRFAFSTSYEFGDGWDVTFQAGYNELKANWIRSFGLTPLGVWWSKDPQDSEDQSYELRLSSPTDGRFSWLVGVNYYEQDFIQSGSGGDAVWLCTSFDPTRPLGAPCSGVQALFPNTLLQNTDHIETLGVFASISFDITDSLNLSVEARYQDDEVTSAVLTTSPTKIADESWLPRVILSWQPTPDTNLYASYAVGILPGIVNSQVASATPRELAQYQEQFPGVAGIVKGDELDMYELGWKQRWADGRAQTEIAAYYGEWAYQKGRSVFIIFEDCGSPSHGAGGAECPNGPDGSPALTPNSRNANVPGDSTLWGVEFTGTTFITDNWDLRATFTWAKSEYDDFLFNFVQPIAGFTQMKGNSNARFPEYSGSLYSGYQARLGNSDWDWYVNGDVSYFGKAYVDESNLAECDAYTLTNVRAGVEKDGLRIEGFVKNAFDDDSWTACARWTDFDTAPNIFALTTYQGIAVQAQVPRQYGLRATVEAVINYAGLRDRVQAVPTKPFDAATPLPDVNPLGKVPTLLLDDGEYLAGGPVIYEYLDTLHDRPRLFPQDGTRRFRTLRQAWMADGLFDTFVLIVIEAWLPSNEQRPAYLERCWSKVVGILDRMERDSGSYGALDIAQVRGVGALAFIDLKAPTVLAAAAGLDPDFDWREGRARLTRWYEELSPAAMFQTPLLASD